MFQSHLPPARRSVSTGIAWSANLGFADLAARYPDDFQRFHKELGWLGDMTVETAIGATLGIGTQPAGPADVMQLLAAIETGRVEPFGMFESDHRHGGNGKVIDLAALGIDESERWQVKRWLHEPVRVGTVKGTAARIKCRRAASQVWVKLVQTILTAAVCPKISSYPQDVETDSLSCMAAYGLATLPKALWVSLLIKIWRQCSVQQFMLHSRTNLQSERT